MSSRDLIAMAAARMAEDETLRAANKQALSALEWITQPVRDRLARAVKERPDKLLLTTVEYRALMVYYNGGQYPNLADEPGWAFYGIPLEVKDDR